jgi:hypothetical protein
MAILNKLTGAFPTAIIYITVGTLISVWTVVWLVFNEPETRQGYFWPVGFLITGIAVLAIGLFLGRIGRSARKAEMAPAEVIQASTNAEQVAAARPVVVPNNGVMGNQIVQPNAAVAGVAPGTAVPTAAPQVVLPNANPAPMRM